MANFYDDNNDRDVLTGGTYVNYYGGGGNDVLYGNSQANGVYGGEGNDIVTGSYRTVITGNGTPETPWTYVEFEAPSGNDVLEGGSGNDALYGADGDDKLYGGQGDESGLFLGWIGYTNRGGLYGGLGRDAMWGGEGTDWFVFQSANESGATIATADVIRDFSREEGDKVDVSGMGDFDFIGKKKFKGDGDAELNFKNGRLSGDVDGDGGTDFMIRMVGISKMKDGDFIL
jgi:serralysin